MENSRKLIDSSAKGIFFFFFLFFCFKKSEKNKRNTGNGQKGLHFPSSRLLFPFLTRFVTGGIKQNKRRSFDFFFLCKKNLFRRNFTQKLCSDVITWRHAASLKKKMNEFNLKTIKCVDTLVVRRGGGRGERKMAQVFFIRRNISCQKKSGNFPPFCRWGGVDGWIDPPFPLRRLPPVHRVQSFFLKKI